MGLFGGGNSTQSSTTNNFDLSQSLGLSNTSGVTVAGTGNTVLDAGAIDAAFAYSETMGNSAFQFAGDSLGFASSALSSVENANASALKIVANSSKSEGTQLALTTMKTVQTVGLGVGALVVAAYFLKRKS